MWYAVCNTATGELISIGTEVRARPGMTVIELDREPDQRREQWNPATRIFEPRPVGTRDSDFELMHSLIAKGGKNLTQQDRDTLLVLMAKRILGG